SRFFGSVGAGSLCGGTVHGFFLGGPPVGYKILWSATLVALGGAALSAWAMGANLLLPNLAVRRIVWIATVQYALYVALVSVRRVPFSVAILDYAPAILFLLIAL